MLKKLMNYLCASRKNALLFATLCGSFCVFFPVLLSRLLVKLPWLSKFSIEDLSSALLVTFVGLFLCLSAYMLWTAYKEEREDEKKLKNRTIADFEQQYPVYADLVNKMLQKEDFQTINLDPQWIKLFEFYLSNIAPLRKDCFTDFEIAACLMFAVTPKLFGTVHLKFAFECAKELICEMNSYNVSYLNDHQLQLEAVETSSMIDFSIPDKKLSNEATLSLLGTYLSLRSNIYSILPLADFLRILYVRQQKLQS